MKQDDTKREIIEKALELFAERGYDAVSVGEIAAAVGIKAPSLYNHYKNKQAIFEAIVEDTAARYERDTDNLDVHVQDVTKDFATFGHITVQALTEKVRGIFLYSLHYKNVSLFRKMMTIEQFRSPELAALYSARYVDRMVEYHANIFRNLIAAGEIANLNAITLAYAYVSPVITLLGVCDRQPEREEECLKKLGEHVKLFFDTYNISAK